MKLSTELFTSEHKQAYTDRVLKNAEQKVVSRKEMPSNQEALQELDELRTWCIQSPFRVYLEGETTLVLAMRN